MRNALFLVAVLCAAAQEPAVRLRLGTTGGRVEFHIGEPIPVTLNFEVRGPQGFQISTDIRLRHLRPQGPDEFSATPADGCVDPLGDLQWTMDAMGPSNGSWGSARLDALHPAHIERDLNEFIVFRKPGRYVVRATSDRVAGLGKRLDTNGIVLNILPRDEPWTARQFAAAKAILEAGKPPKEPERVFDTNKDNAQVDAVRSLRYLETEAAARYLVSIYGHGRRSDSEIEYALLALPYREAIVDEFERQMADPDLTLTQSYLILLTQIQARLLEHQLGRSLSHEDWKALDDATDKRVFEAASGKNPEAKAGTYYYLFEVGSGDLRGSPEVLRRLTPLLPSASHWVVEMFLTMDWGTINSVKAEILPFLKEAVARSWPQFNPSVAGLALLRLNELDAQAAQDAALKELLSDKAHIGDPELLELTLPASRLLDRALLAQYQQGRPVEARIARFASADIKEDLWRASSAKPERNGERQNCATPLFAYFFRVDPSAASERLGEIRKAGGNACTALEFSGLERQLMSPGLERQLIVDAKSGTPNIQLAAFRMLSIAGSHAALPTLLDTIEQASGQKQELIAAVLNGRRWVLMDSDFARLTRDCVGTDMCREIERRQSESQPPYTLRSLDLNGRRGVWLINREVDTLTDLSAIIEQFPAGTTFRWEPNGRRMNPDEQETREKVRALLTSRGMTLQN
jgi:hypothetical protein